MATKRSTKTLGDLYDYANDTMCASLNKLRAEDPSVFYDEVRDSAVALRTKCKDNFPGILEDCNRQKLLPISNGAHLLVVNGFITRRSHRPGWAIWASVLEYLEEHWGELGL